MRLMEFLEMSMKEIGRVWRFPYDGKLAVERSEAFPAPM